MFSIGSRYYSAYECPSPTTSSAYSDYSFAYFSSFPEALSSFLSRL